MIVKVQMALDQTQQQVDPEKMPVVFIGHGSPMNAITENSFTQALTNLGHLLPRPRAILCVSAHWMTEGTWITHMKHPKTIHDFYGFPQELFEVQYPAPGSPEIADEIQSLIEDPKIHSDDQLWGLDHGTWSILRHMHPKADIPVLQLSLYMSQPPEYHFQLGHKLRKLRHQGILVVGSGNIVHNLRRIKWEHDAQPYNWAIEFDQWSKEKLEKRDFQAFMKDYLSTEAGRLSVPSPDHYYPLLYILGASEPSDKLRFDFEGIQNGSISMRCLTLM